MALSEAFQSYVRETANAYGVPVNLAFALITQESGGNQGARSSKGATGIMQLMPSTARELGVDPTDPYQNIEGGLRYLAQQKERFGSWPLALAAYNAGPTAVRKHGGIPPFAETQNYVPSILERAGMLAGGASSDELPSEALASGRSESDPAMDLKGRSAAFDMNDLIDSLFPEPKLRLPSPPPVATTGRMGQMSPLSRFGIPNADMIDRYSTPNGGGKRQQ